MDTRALARRAGAALGLTTDETIRAALEALTAGLDLPSEDEAAAHAHEMKTRNLTPFRGKPPRRPKRDDRPKQVAKRGARATSAD